jgi:hypothetical protein
VHQQKKYVATVRSSAEKGEFMLFARTLGTNKDKDKKFNEMSEANAV